MFRLLHGFLANFRLVLREMEFVYKYSEYIAADFIERLIEHRIPKFKGLYHTCIHS